MDLFTYLLAKNDKFSLAHKNDLFSYLLGKSNSIPLKTAEGVTITIEALKRKINELKMTKESTQDGAPTPDNPIPVEVVEGYIKDGNNYVDVMINGKNLLNYIDNLRTNYLGLVSKVNDDGSITTEGIPTANYASIIRLDITSILENGATYTISQKDMQYKKLYLQLNITDRNGGPTQYVTLQTGTSASFVADTDNKTYMFNLQTGTITDWGSSSLTITNYYQLEKSSAASVFQPYKESIVSIPLNGNFIAGIGDYKDTLMVDKYGKCYLNKVIEKKVLDGSENWIYASVTQGSLFRIINVKASIANKIPLSNNYIGVQNSNNRANNKFYYNATIIGFDFVDNRYTNVNDFKAWLQNKYNNSDSVYIVYPLAQEELIDLNYTVDLKLFKGENNISNSEDMMMTLKYY